VRVSINGLLKCGADREMQMAIQQQELLQRRHPNLSARDVIEAIEEAVPYGHTSRAELERAVEESLKKKSRQLSGPTLKGFWEYVWNDEEAIDESIEEEIKKYQLAQALPRLEWERLLDYSRRRELDERQIEQLVVMLADTPELMLFRLPEEVVEVDGIHPSFRARILYLWHNRHEIQTANSSWE
jgi:hypothetical protein